MLLLTVLIKQHPDAARALSAVCTLPQGRNALSDYVADCAAYLRILCAWDGIDALRASADAMWHGQDQSDVLRSMPTLQQLTNKALDAAVGGRSANVAFHALRHAMIEDAISLFRAQTAGASADCAAASPSAVARSARPPKPAAPVERARRTPEAARRRDGISKFAPGS